MSPTAVHAHEADPEEDADVAFPWLNVIGLFVLGVVLMGIHGLRDYDGLTDPDTMEMAAVGRNMAEGRGFVASCVRPVDVWFMTEHAKKTATVEHMPDLRHGPVFPSIMAALYLVTGLDGSLPVLEFTHRAEFFVMLPMTILFTLLSGLLVFLATRRLAGMVSAQLALAMYMVALPILDLSLWGGASALLLLLGAAALLAVVRAVAHRDGQHGEEMSGWLAPILLAGFLVGLAVLTRYGAFVLGVVLLVYLFHGHDRRRARISCWVFLVTAVATVAPWIVRNVIVTGAPFGLAPYGALDDSALFEGNGFQASLHPVLGNLAVTRAMKAKLIANGLGLLQGNLGSLGAGVLIVLLGVSLFVKFEKERVLALRHAAVGGVLVAVIIAALSGTGVLDAMAVLLPGIIVLATAGFYELIHNTDFHEPERETLAVLALLLWASAPSALALFGAGTHRPYPPYHPPFIRHVSGLLSRGEILCTDIPWATAWYGGRTSILLPRSVDGLTELRESVPSVAGLYVTTETAQMLYSESGSRHARISWRPLLMGLIPPGFPFTESITFPPSSRDQWFFTDRQHLSSR